MQCAEIYGHVEWIQACECVDEATGLRDNVTVAEPRVGSANLYFSVPAFVVLFRVPGTRRFMRFLCISIDFYACPWISLDFYGLWISLDFERFL